MITECHMHTLRLFKNNNPSPVADLDESPLCGGTRTFEPIEPRWHGRLAPMLVAVPAEIAAMIKACKPGDRFWGLAADGITYDLVGLGLDLNNNVHVGHFAGRER